MPRANRVTSPDLIGVLLARQAAWVVLHEMQWELQARISKRPSRSKAWLAGQSLRHRPARTILRWLFSALVLIGASALALAAFDPDWSRKTGLPEAPPVLRQVIVGAALAGTAFVAAQSPREALRRQRFLTALARRERRRVALAVLRGRHSHLNPTRLTLATEGPPDFFSTPSWAQSARRHFAVVQLSPGLSGALYLAMTGIIAAGLSTVLLTGRRELNTEWMMWMPLVFLSPAVASAILLGRLRTTVVSRYLAGRCMDCGYDLTAIPPAAFHAPSLGPEVCPECGCAWPRVPPPTAASDPEPRLRRARG